eukprot:TRINITY_DN2490_c0_g1_i1.p1 TRINITY_DN2490_c0_g1~~TRINITY_DN2490_c0_g1_i1.p1  ORF type:complete len:410 (+),score=35.87 TRINITY_DN2490_c0_g1_i1:37-1230(+)
MAANLNTTGLYYVQRANIPDLVLALGDSITVGRSRKLPKEQRLQADARVSSRHCTFHATATALTVTDHSINGTFVNGARVGEGKIRVLFNDDTVTLCFADGDSLLMPQNFPVFRIYIPSPPPLLTPVVAPPAPPFDEYAPTLVVQEDGAQEVVVSPSPPHTATKIDPLAPTLPRIPSGSADDVALKSSQRKGTSLAVPSVPSVRSGALPPAGPPPPHPPVFPPKVIARPPVRSHTSLTHDDETSSSLPPPQASAEALDVSVDPQDAEVVWYYQEDLHHTESGSEGWAPYPEAVSAKIEAAYQAEKEVERLNGKYSVHFADLRQFQTLDKDKQRPIKRMLQETSKVPWRIGIRPKEVPDIWPGETKRKATRAVPSDDDRDEDYVEAKTRKSKKASSKT